ncbi:MAG TPA: FKBP-type peptidyl-prolyl cis-trans isomerase [Segetibacter sp.]|jgi:FKBP-type peptidyl-prolyl cis-trans isomerase
MKQILSILSLAIIMASCNTKYEKTASGLTYKIVEGDGKQKLKFGDIVKINGIVKVSGGKDTVLFTTYGKLPEYIPVDTATKKSHDFNEVLKFCSVGDSLIVVAQVDTLVKMGALQYNEVFKKGGQITTSLKLLKTFASQEEAMKDQTAEVEKYKVQEVANVEAYLKKKGVKALKTMNGAFVEVTNPGEALKGTTGKQVTVMYRGSLMETGKVFDTNMDTSFGHIEPFSFVTGSGQTIRAWEEAFQYFGKGGKGKIYVPSLLGYGPAGQQGVIPPYASLVFEVEVRDIGDAPKQQPQQMVPGDPRQQQQQSQQQPEQR